MSTLQNKTDIKNNMCCIVIPIYKNKLADEEVASLKQCCSILNEYTIIYSSISIIL